MKKIFGFLLLLVLCLSTVLISAKNGNVFRNNVLRELDKNRLEEVATDTTKNKKKKSVKENEIKNEDKTDEKNDESVENEDVVVKEKAKKNKSKAEENILVEEETAIEDEVVIKPSTLVIQSVPKKALVYIDEELRGKTPLKIKDIIPADYEIRIEKEGYEEKIENISIQEGEAFNLNVTLNKIVEIVEVVEAEVKEEIVAEAVVTESVEDVDEEPTGLATRFPESRDTPSIMLSSPTYIICEQ